MCRLLLAQMALILIVHCSCGCGGHAVDSADVSVAGSIDPEVQKNVARLAEKIKTQKSERETGDSGTSNPDGAKPVPKVIRPMTPLLASSQQDLRFIPTDAFAAMVIHPRRHLQHAVIKAMSDLVPPELAEEMSRGDALAQQVGQNSAFDAKQLKEITEACDMPLETVDEIVLLVDKQLVELVNIYGETKVVPGLPPGGIILRHSAPFNAEAILGYFCKLGSTVEVEPYEGTSLAVVATDSEHPEWTLAIALITDSMLVFGETGFVKKMISARTQTMPTSGLTRQLEAHGNRLYMIGVDGTAVADPLKKAAAKMPGVLALFSPYIVGTKELLITNDFEAPEFFQVLIEFKNPNLTAGLFGILEHQFKTAKQKLQVGRESIHSDATMKPLLPYYDQFVAETTLTTYENVIEFNMSRIKEFELMPERIAPLFAVMAKGARVMKEKRESAK